MRRALIVVAGLLLALGLVGQGPVSLLAPLLASESDVVSLGASEDTFLNSAHPDEAFGERAFLKIDNRPKIALYRFEVAYNGRKSCRV